MTIQLDRPVRTSDRDGDDWQECFDKHEPILLETLPEQLWGGKGSPYIEQTWLCASQVHVEHARRRNAELADKLPKGLGWSRVGVPEAALYHVHRFALSMTVTASIEGPATQRALTRLYNFLLALGGRA